MRRAAVKTATTRKTGSAPKRRSQVRKFESPPDSRIHHSTKESRHAPAPIRGLFACLGRQVGIESMPFSNLRRLGTNSLFHAQAHRTCPGTVLVNLKDGAEPSRILDAERLGPACRPGQTGNLSEG